MAQHGEASTAVLPQFPQSFWLDSVDKLPQFPTLTADLKTDVVVIGAGITGITTAYLLAKRGVKVVILNAGPILEGTTGHTTAKITTQHGLIYHEFLSHFGEEKTRLYYEANQEGLLLIKQTIHELGIECQLTEEDAYLYTSDEAYVQQLQDEYMAYGQMQIGGDYLESTPLPFATKGAIRLKGQARFNPVPYLIRLLQEITKLGGQIYQGTTVVGATHEQPSAVTTKQGFRVTCHHVVTASHYPFNDMKGAYFTRLHAEKSYVIAARTKKAYPGGMYINVEQPSRSLRAVTIHGEPAVLIGGEGHKTGQGLCTHLYYENLQKFGEDMFGLQEILYRWSAQDVFTLDKMPYIGQQFSDAPHLLMATGFRKWGMTTSMAAALLNSKIILGEKSSYEDVFTPHRFHADPSIRTFVAQNANVAKEFVAGKFDLVHKQPEELSPDEGSVVSVNGKRAGAYREPSGELHIVDTTCTHLGCEVDWNDAERTWDCPCHGSRYSFQGDVIEGPAKKALAKLSIEA